MTSVYLNTLFCITSTKIVPQIAAPIAGGVNSLSGDGEHWELAPEEEEEENVQYPVLLCMLGSAGGSMKVIYKSMITKYNEHGMV